MDRKKEPMGKPPFAPVRRTVVPSQSASGNATGVPPGSQWEGLPDETFTPLGWETVFDGREEVRIDELSGSVRAYFVGNRNAGTVMVLFHGGGQTALSWSALCRELAPDVKQSGDVLLFAFDCRGHGSTTIQPENELSADRMVQDAITLLHTLFPSDGRARKFVFVGHSMGAAIATRLVVSKQLNLDAYGIVNIDVVEGTALEALPYMKSFVHNRPESFKTPEAAVKYMLVSNQLRNLESARLSVVPQLRFDDHRREYVWRTDLEATEKYWKGWFAGLSTLFLSAPVMKVLVLAGVERLDKTLTIAQMQGKFQNQVVRGSGHAVHEDEPKQLAAILSEFLRRNQLI